jgi:hypothetical protein
MSANRKSHRLLVVLAVLLVSLLGGAPFIRDAQAIIGMPLTPFSFAGVARRTTRRAMWYGGAASPYYGAPYGAPYPAPYPPPPPYYPPPSPYW